MNTIPLVNNNSVNDINTSLIAIKKNLNNQGQLQDVDVNVGINIATNCTYCAASSTTIKGAQLYNGCSIKVLFTSAITGSDTTTPMSINYNDVSIPVKTGKNGVLSNFVANNIGGSYIYCQAYTTLELLFDGTQFIIMGNPVVISSADYTIYTDGSITYQRNVDWLCQKAEASHISSSSSTYLTFKINVSDKTGYLLSKLYIRIRNSVRLIYVSTNDNSIVLAQKQLVESGFISELKYSASEQKIYIKTYNYPGHPTIYFEHQAKDNVSVSNITHSTTPYTLPSDAANIASVL